MEIKQLELDYKRETGLPAKDVIECECGTFYTDEYVEYLENKIYELLK